MAATEASIPEPMSEKKIEAETKEFSCEQLDKTVFELKTIELEENPQEKADILMAEDPVVNAISTEDKNSKDEIESISAKESSRGITEPGQHNPSSKNEEIVTKTEEMTQENGGILLETDENEAANSSIGVDHFTESSSQATVTLEGALETSNAGEKREGPIPIIAKELENDSQLQKQNISESEDRKHGIKKTDSSEADISEEIEGEQLEESSKIVSEDRTVESTEERDKPRKEKPISAISLDEQPVSQAAVATDPEEQEKGSKNNEDLPGSATEEQNLEVGAGSEIKEKEIETEETTEKNIDGKSVACLIEEADHEKLGQFSSPEADQQIPESADPSKVMESVVRHEEKVSNQSFNTISGARASDEESQQKGGPASEELDRTAESVSDAQIVETNTAGRDADEAAGEKHSDIASSDEVPEGKTDLGTVGATESMEAEDCKEEGSRVKDHDADAVPIRQESEESSFQEDTIEGKEIETVTTDTNTQNNETKIENIEESSDLLHDEKSRQPNDPIQNIEEEIRQKEEAEYVTTVTEEKTELEEEKPEQAADIASEEKSHETNETGSQLEEVEGVKIEETSIPASEIPPVGESDGADKESPVEEKPDELPVIQALVKEILHKDESQHNEPKNVSKPASEEKNAEEITETENVTAEIQKVEESPHEVPSTEAEADAREKIETEIQTEADFLEKNTDISSVAPASEEMPSLKEEGETSLQKAELEDEKPEQAADIASEEKSHETNETGSQLEEVEGVKIEETSITASEIPPVGESDGADKGSPVEKKPDELPVIQALVKEILQRDESQDNKPKSVSKPLPEEKNAEEISETENVTAEIKKEEESPHEVPSTEADADARDKIETEIRTEADFLEKNADISSVAPASEEMPSLKEEGEHANIVLQTVSSQRDFDSSSATQEATGDPEIEYENPAKASDIASEEKGVERTADADTSSSEILIDDSSDKKLQEFSELMSKERVLESVHMSEKTDEPLVKQALIEESLQKDKIQGQGPQKATELVLEEKNAEEIIMKENAAAEIPKEEENPYKTPATETPAEEDARDHGLKTADARENIETDVQMEEEIQENNLNASSVPPVEETSAQQEQGQQANIVPETVSKEHDYDASSTMQEAINSGEVEYERLVKASDTGPIDQEAETSSSQILVDDSSIEKLHESSKLTPEDQIPIGNGTQDKHVEETCLQGEVEGDKLEEVTTAVSEDKETTSETETAVCEIRKDEETSQKEENEKPYKAPDLEANDHVSKAKEADRDLEREIAEEKKESYESTVSSSALADDKAGENLAEPVEEVSDEQDLGTTDSGSKVENEVPNEETAHHINADASSVAQSSGEIFSQKEAAETEETQNKGHDIAAATQAQGEKAFDSASEDKTVETVVEAEPAKIEISEGNESCDTMIDSPSTVKASVEETTREGAPADELEENTEKKIEKGEATAGTSSQIEETEGKTLDKDYEHPEQKLSEIINAGEISNDAETWEPSSNKDILEGQKIEKTFDVAPEELETVVGRDDTEKEVPEKEEIPVKNIEESFQEDGKGVESLEHAAAELHRASYNTTNETPNEEILRIADPTIEIEADETKDMESPDKNIDNLPVSYALAEEAIQEERGEKQDETSEFAPEETAPEKVESASESVSEEKSYKKITETETTETLPSVAEEQTCKAIEVSESMESVALEEEKTSDGATSGSRLQMENVEGGKELDYGDKSESFVALENREEEMPKQEETSGTDLENNGTEYDQLVKPTDIVAEGLETAHQSEEIEKRIVDEEGLGKGVNTVPAGDEQVEESLEKSKEHKMPEGATPELDVEDLSCNTNDISEITIPHEEVFEALTVAGASKNIEKQTMEEEAIKDLNTLSATDKPVKESSWEDEKKQEKLEEATHHLEAEGQSTKDAAKDGQNEEVQASDLVSEERDFETIASTEKIETVALKAAEDPNKTIDASTVKIALSDEPLETVSEGPKTTSSGEDSEKHVIEGTVKGVDDVSVQEEPVEESQCKKLEEVTPEMEVEDQTCKTNDIIDIPNEEVSEGRKAADAGEYVEKQTTEEEGVVKDLDTSSTRAAAAEENFQEDEHKKLKEATPQLEAEDQHYESNDTTYPTKSSQNDEAEASDLVSKEREFETTGPTEAIESVTTKGDEPPNEITDAPPVKTASIENPLDAVPEGIKTAGICEDVQKQLIEEEGTVKGVDDVSVQEEPVEENQCKKLEEVTPEMEVEDQTCKTNDIIDIPNEEVSEGLEEPAASENVQKQKTEEEDVVKDLDTSSTRAVVVEENFQEEEHKKLEEATPQSSAEDQHYESNSGIDPTRSGPNEEVEVSDLVSTTSSTEAIETVTSKGEEDPNKITDALPEETASTENPLGMVSEGLETARRDKDAQEHIIEEEGTIKGIDTVSIIDELVQEGEECKKPKEATFELEAEDQSHQTNDVNNITEVSEGQEAAVADKDIEKPPMEEEGSVKDLDSLSAKDESAEESIQENLKEHKKLKEATTLLEIEDEGSKANDTIDTTQNGQDKEVTYMVEASDLVSKEQDFETTASAEKIETATLKGVEDPNVIIDASPVKTTSAETPLDTVSEELETIGRGEVIEKQIIEEEGTVKSLDSASVGEEPFQESESQKLEEKTAEMEANDQSQKTDDNTEIENSNMEVPEVLEAADGCENSEKQTTEEERAVKDLDTSSAKEEEICSQKEAAETEEIQNKRHDIAAETQAQGEKAFNSASEDKTIETVAEAEPAKIKILEGNASCDTKIDSPSVEASVEETARKGAPADVLEENTEKEIEKSEATAGTSLQIEETEGKTLDKDYEHPEQKFSEIINAGEISNDVETSEPSSNKDTSVDEKIEKTFDIAPEELEKSGERADTEKDVLEKEEVPVKNLEESFQEDRMGSESLEHGAAELHCASYNTTNETTNEENLRTFDPTNEIETDEKEEENPNKNIDNLPVSNAAAEEAIQEERGEKQDETSEFVPEDTAPEKLKSASESVSEDKSHEKITAMETTETLPSVAEEQTCRAVEVSQSMESVTLEEEKTPDEATLGSSLQTENVEGRKELDSGDISEKFVALENREEEMPKNDETSGTDLQNDGTEYDQLEKPTDIVSNGLETAHQSEEIEKRVIEEEGTGKGIDTVPAGDEQVKESLEESEEHKMPEGVTPKLDTEDLSGNTNDIPEITIPHEEVPDTLAVTGTSENIEKQTKEERDIKDLDTFSATDKTVKETIQEDEKKHEKLEEPTHHLEAEEQSCEANDTRPATKDRQNEEVQASDLVSQERDLETIASTEKIETAILEAAEDPNETIDASPVKIALSDEPLELVSEGPEITGGDEDSEKRIIKGTGKGVDDVSVQEEPVEENQCKKLEEVTPEMEAEDQTCKTNDIIDIPNEEVFEVHKTADAGENVEKQTTEEEGVVKDLDTSSTRAVAVKENFQEDEHKKLEEATPQSEAEDQHYKSDDAIDPIKSSQSEEVKASDLVPKEPEFKTTSSTEAIESVTSKGDGDPNEMTDASPVKTASTENTLDRVPVGLEIAGEGEDIQKQIIEEEVTVKGVDTVSIIDEPAQESEECDKPKEATFELEAEDQSYHTNDVNNITEVSKGHEAAVVGKDIEKPLMEEEGAVKDLDSLSVKEEPAEERILEDLNENKKLEQATPLLEIEDKGSEAKDTIDTTENGQDEEVKASDLVSKEQDFKTTASTEKIETVTLKGDEDPNVIIDASSVKTSSAETPSDMVSEELETIGRSEEIKKQIIEEEGTVKSLDSASVGEQPFQECESQKHEEKTAEMEANDQSHKTDDIKEIENSNVEVPKGLEAAGCENSEKQTIEEERAVKDLDSLSSRDEAVEESFQEELKENRKPDEAKCHSEAEEQSCKVNDTTHTITDAQSEKVEASDFVSTERNFETTLSTEKIEAFTLKSDENPNEIIDSSSIETPSAEETKQEGGTTEHQEAIGSVSEEKNIELDITTEDTVDEKLERALESVSVEGDPAKIEVSNNDEGPDKTVDALPDSVQESTQKEAPQVEDEQCCKESNEVSESTESTVLEEVKATNGTESEQLETSCELGSEDKSKQTDAGDNRAHEMAKEKETLYVGMKGDRTESEQLQEPSQTSVGLKTAAADENTENQIIEHKSSVADNDTVFVRVEAVEETIQEDKNESMKVGEAAAELEFEGQGSETKETNETTTNRVHIEEASMGLGAADSSENIEKHIIGEDRAAKELNSTPVRGEVPSLETNDADDTTKTGIPSEKIETVIVEDDKASLKNIEVFPVTTTLTEENTQEEARDAKEDIHETINANERNVEVATDEMRISEGPVEVEKVKGTFDDSDSIRKTSNLIDAAEATNLKDDEVLNRNPNVSAITKASGVEILLKENAAEPSIWVPEEITEAEIEQAAAEESFSKEEIESEQLKDEVIHQTRETETPKHEENQQIGLDSPPIPEASAVEILQKEGEKPDKAPDLESEEQIQEEISLNDVQEIHIPRPEEATDELQDLKKLQDTTDMVLEELGHEKVDARETAEIAIEEEEEDPQKNINGLSVTHTSDEGGKITEAADLVPEAPSHETVTTIDGTDPAPTETTTLESKEENVKFVTIPESEKMECVTLKAEESLNRSFDVFSFPQASGEEISQIEGSEKYAGFEDILQDNDNKATLQISHDPIEKTSHKAIVEDRKPGEALEVEADLKGTKLEEKQDSAAEKRTEAATEDSIEELKESDSSKVSLSDLLDRSKRENMKTPADLMQERHPAVKEDELGNKQAGADQAEEEKTDEEEEEDDEHKKDESGSDAPVIVEAARDIDLKPAHKKSHNILSGVGSKVKHSIAKVKKAITGKSTHPKSLPAK